MTAAYMHACRHVYTRACLQAEMHAFIFFYIIFFNFIFSVWLVANCPH